MYATLCNPVVEWTCRHL